MSKFRSAASVSLAVAVLLMPAWGPSPGRDLRQIAPAGGPPIARVSVSSAGVQADSDSWNPAVSDDGRFVVFSSLAGNLVAGDSNGASDIFLHDRETGLTQRISVDSQGRQANGDSLSPSISPDGTIVAFGSMASNLAPGDTNNAEDAFVRTGACSDVEDVDLDVTFISRTPLYHAYCVEYTWDVPNQPGLPYLCPGTEGDRRWPEPGEIVTFTAHVVNKGTAASPPAGFAWSIDGSIVAGGTLPGPEPQSGRTKSDGCVTWPVTQSGTYTVTEEDRTDWTHQGATRADFTVVSGGGPYNHTFVNRPPILRLPLIMRHDTNLHSGLRGPVGGPYEGVNAKRYASHSALTSVFTGFR